MIGNESHVESPTGIPWDGTTERRAAPMNEAGNWFQYRYLVFDKLNNLEKKVDEIEKVVDEIKDSFIKLQTKIMVVSAISGVVSAALITAVFTALADKFLK